MKILNPNRVTEKRICGEYVDTTGIRWEYKAYVQISCTYEVLGARMECLEGFDINDEVVQISCTYKVLGARMECLEGFDINDEVVKTSDYLTEGLLQAIQEHAGHLALEKTESVDFEREDERE